MAKGRVGMKGERTLTRYLSMLYLGIGNFFKCRAKSDAILVVKIGIGRFAGRKPSSCFAPQLFSVPL